MNVATAAAVTWTIPTAGAGPMDPAAAQAQVNAQAETLSALMGTKHNMSVANSISDGKGVDLYL